MGLRLGRVSYINSLPLFCAKPPFDVVSKCPSELNAMTARGELDMSLISRWVFEGVAKDYRVLPEFCIAGDGEIMSVKIFSRVPLAKLAGRKICITSETGSSSRAFRHVVKKRHGFDIFSLEKAEIGSADAVLLIGNAALAFCDPDYGHVCDLGEMWKDVIGKKMIYASVVVRREIYDAAAAALAEYFEKSLGLFQVDRSRNILLAREMFAKSQGTAISVETLDKYYSRLIYRLDENDYKEAFDIAAKLSEHERF